MAFDAYAEILFTSDGQMESIHPTQLTRLRGMGLVFRAGGRWRTELNVMEVARLVAEQMPVCDFCSRPDPEWTFPCKSFEEPRVVGIERRDLSVGAWGACERCALLIRTGKWERLALRSLDKLCVKHPELSGHQPRLLAYLRALHARFAANRTGTAGARRHERREGSVMRRLWWLRAAVEAFIEGPRTRTGELVLFALGLALCAGLVLGGYYGYALLRSTGVA